MIILEPSAGIKKATGIDFKLLSNILTMLLEVNHKRDLDIIAKIHKSKISDTSLCEAIDRNNFLIKLDQTAKQTKKFIFSSLLHELRHCCQYHIWKYWPDTGKFKTYADYYRSKEEVDARKIERLTREVIKMYDLHVTFNSKFTDLRLNKLG
jgi:hypothetical protein